MPYNACNFILKDSFLYVAATREGLQDGCCTLLPVFFPKEGTEPNVVVLATMEQLRDLYALQPSPDIASNPVNPPSLTGASLACNITCLTVATFFVLVRVYTRTFVVRSPGWDDCEQSSSRTEQARLTSSRCVLYCLGTSFLFLEWKHILMIL